MHNICGNFINYEDHLLVNKQQVACGLLIDTDEKILICQRPATKYLAGLWEFPGGKIEEGESPEFALIRELAEELDIKVSPSCLMPLTFASHYYPDNYVTIFLFSCRRWEGIIQPKEGQLTKWVMPRELREYPMPEANRSMCSIILSAI